MLADIPFTGLSSSNVKIEPAASAFLFAHLNGALASVDESGHPYTSAVNLVPDGDGRLLMLISALAEHSKNLAAETRCSVMMLEPAADWQATPRLSLVGRVEPVVPEEGERYLHLFPQARDYLQLDFSFLGLVVERARWIPGFARAVWLDAAALGLALPWSMPREREMVDHMNQDHVDALHHYARRLGREPQAVSMVCVDPWGAWLRADDECLRLPFDQPARTPRAVREALVALARS